MWKRKNIKVYYGYHYTNFTNIIQILYKYHHKIAICKTSIFSAMAV